jgi:hypothetical protein
LAVDTNIKSNAIPTIGKHAKDLIDAGRLASQDYIEYVNVSWEKMLQR